MNIDQYLTAAKREDAVLGWLHAQSLLPGERLHVLQSDRTATKRMRRSDPAMISTRSIMPNEIARTVP
jgi:hypothetical protein